MRFSQPVTQKLGIVSHIPLERSTTMPFLERLTAKLTDRMPSMITPRVHAALEMASAGGFLLYAASTWGRDKNVAVTSAGCGLFLLANVAVTDYAISSDSRMQFDAHGR